MRAHRLGATGNLGPFGGANSFTRLGSVVVGTGAASAVLTVYDGQSASGTVISTIDASAKGYYRFDCECKNGVFAVLSGGNADVTVVCD